MKDPPCRLHSSPVFYLMTRGVYRQFQTHWERKFEAQWLGGFWIVEEKNKYISRKKPDEAWLPSPPCCARRSPWRQGNKKMSDFLPSMPTSSVDEFQQEKKIILQSSACFQSAIVEASECHTSKIRPNDWGKIQPNSLFTAISWNSIWLSHESFNITSTSPQLTPITLPQPLNTTFVKRKELKVDSIERLETTNFDYIHTLAKAKPKSHCEYVLTH